MKLHVRGSYTSDNHISLFYTLYNENSKVRQVDFESSDLISFSVCIQNFNKQRLNYPVTKQWTHFECRLLRFGLQNLFMTLTFWRKNTSWLIKGTFNTRPRHCRFLLIEINIILLPWMQYFVNFQVFEKSYLNKDYYWTDTS